MPARLFFGGAGIQPFCAHQKKFGVQDYGTPKPVGLRRTQPELRGRDEDRVASAPSTRLRWWQYQAPRNYTTPKNYQIVPVGLPQYGVGAGSGGSIAGSGGSNSGGGGGSGGSGSNGDSGSSRGNGGSDPMRWPTYWFCILLFGGGLGAYIKRGSTASLMTSSAVATLLLIATSLTGHSVGTWLALGTCTLLGGFMGLRAWRSKKLFPAGMVALLSLLMSAGYAQAL